MKKTKPVHTGKNDNARSNNLPKGKVTRERIIEAARRVFSEHPYHVASIRMIGKAGGFDHQLIRYYFPSKAELFEAVVAELCEEYFQGNISWLSGLDRIAPREGFPMYIDRFLDYNFKHPEALRIMALNSTLTGDLSELPGYNHIPEVLAKTRSTFEQNVPLRAGPVEVGMFINSFNSIVIFFLGSASCQAQVLEMSADSEEYRKWVKDTLVFMFLPRLEKLIAPGE